MIKTIGLTKHFNTFVALHKVSFSVEPGRVIGVIGSNGSGKSTLIKCLVGLVKPTDGVILYNGCLPDKRGLYRENIGYMPQVATFPQDLTGREVMNFLSHLRSALPILQNRLFDLFSLHDQLDKRIQTLSGGNRQKLSAVIASMYDPSLLILDEPTAGLDPASCTTLKEYILERKIQGRSILMTTHIISDLEKIADDIILLMDGTIKYSGTIKDLKLAANSIHLESAIARILEKGAA